VYGIVEVEMSWRDEFGREWRGECHVIYWAGGRSEGAKSARSEVR
jgi:hypothetical protein